MKRDGRGCKETGKKQQTRPTMKKLTIVSGASENHSKSLLAFLQSLTTSLDAIDIHIWDFGLDVGSRGILETRFPSVKMHTFDFSKYPEYFNIAIAAGEYAWKPAAIWETALEVREGPLLWCDAGNRLMGSIDPIYAVIKKQGVYSPISAGKMRTWTHPGTLNYMNVPDWMLDMPPRNGAIVGFDLSNPHAMDLLKEWNRLAHIKECIAPEGSNRSNHRQDQAVLSVLYYRSTQGEELQRYNVNMETHHDID